MFDVVGNAPLDPAPTGLSTSWARDARQPFKTCWEPVVTNHLRPLALGQRIEPTVCRTAGLSVFPRSVQGLCGAVSPLEATPWDASWGLAHLTTACLEGCGCSADDSARRWRQHLVTRSCACGRPRTLRRGHNVGILPAEGSSGLVLRSLAIHALAPWLSGGACDPFGPGLYGLQLCRHRGCCSADPGWQARTTPRVSSTGLGCSARCGLASPGAASVASPRDGGLGAPASLERPHPNFGRRHASPRPLVSRSLTLQPMHRWSWSCDVRDWSRLQVATPARHDEM